MKKHIIILMMIGILFSCNKNDEDHNLEDGVIGNWKLIQMTGSVPNSETTGSEMEWQESYQLNVDGTFLKYRNRNGVIAEASGTFNLIEKANESLLEFNFNSESAIIGSCSSGTKETMSFQSKTIFFSLWNACDGPGLKYEKVDEN